MYVYTTYYMQHKNIYYIVKKLYTVLYFQIDIKNYQILNGFKE